jgi:hypothetical protein
MFLTGFDMMQVRSIQTDDMASFFLLLRGGAEQSGIDMVVALARTDVCRPGTRDVRQNHGGIKLWRCLKF